MHYNKNMNEAYKVCVEGGSGETELKKSRFIAHVAPVKSEEEAVSFVNSIKKEYYDARHNCYAYVIGKNSDKVKYSDDGEPQQTAGLPIFNVIKEAKVTDVCIVVTRYFGGTLLGVGPLARMYVEAASLGLKNSKIGTMRYGAEIKIEADYKNAEIIKRYIEKEEITLNNIYYANNVCMYIRVDFNDVEKVKSDLVSLTNSKMDFSKISDAYFIDMKT